MSLLIFISKGDAVGKIWLEPTFERAYLNGFTKKEEKKLLDIAERSKEEFKGFGMNTSTNNYDSLEQLIYSENISIQAIDIHSDQDLLIILLNTGGILRDAISKYPRLKAASEQQLKNYRLIGKGVGVHWPDVDEDLSLKCNAPSASYIQN